MHIATHARMCVYGRPCILSRPTPAADKDGLIAPAAGWHCHSAEPQLHSIQSALVFSFRAQETRQVVAMTTQSASHPSALSEVTECVRRVLCALNEHRTPLNLFYCILQVLKSTNNDNCDECLRHPAPTAKVSLICVLIHPPFFLYPPHLDMDVGQGETKELSLRASGQNPHPSPSLTYTQQALYSSHG